MTPRLFSRPDYRRPRNVAGLVKLSTVFGVRYAAPHELAQRSCRVCIAEDGNTAFPMHRCYLVGVWPQPRSAVARRKRELLSAAFMPFVKNPRPFDINYHPEADAILEDNESLLAWHIGEVSLTNFSAHIGYLDQVKARALKQIALVSEMERILAVNPPLFFRHSTDWRLLDGRHRLTRCHELEMKTVTVAFSTPGVFPA